MGNLDNVVIDGSKIVHIASFIAINDDFSLLKFMNPFPYLFIPLTVNITTCFQFVNAL